MKLTLAVCSVLLLSTACSTLTPARYSVSMDNNQALKAFSGARVHVASLTSAASYDANCRLMGEIQASDDMTIPQFIQKAFNDELKFAGLYSPEGIGLSGRLTKIAFSSMEGLTNGWWDLGLTLTSPNGTSMSVENRYDFKSGFDAFTACSQTAQALGAAVQDLIRKTVTDPQFGALLR